MEQTSTAENFTNETPVAGTEAPSPVTEPGTIETPPEQIEDEQPTAAETGLGGSPLAPEVEPVEDEAAGVEEAPAPPEVEATVGHDLNSGKYLVSIVTRHPDPTVVSVNGKAVWEGVG